MIHYNFDPATGLLIGAAPSDLDPLESAKRGELVYALPAHATRDTPPDMQEGKIARFVSPTGWSLINDVRGVWYGADHQQRVVEELGANVEGLTRIEPPSPDHELIAGQWELSAERVAATLESAKVAAQSAIDAHYQVLFNQAVPNNAMKAEYDAAYMVAKRWLEDPVEPAPERIKALAETYDVPNVQAAQVVVQKWTEAQAVAFDLRGAARLRAKLAIRQAVDLPGVASAELAGRAAMEAVTYSV